METLPHPHIETKDFHISHDAVNIDEHNQVLNHFNTFGLLDRFGNISPIGKGAGNLSRRHKVHK